MIALDYMKNSRIYLGIFLISAATMMLEIGIIRILSVIQFYHFAFLVISIAMFGFAAAGTFLYVKRLKSPLFASAVMFSLSALLCLLFLNGVSFDPIAASVSPFHASALILYYVFLGLPFFFSGIIIAHTFATRQDSAGRVYFWNLSGSAVGTAGVLPAVSFLGEKVIFAAFAVGLLSAVFFARRPRNVFIAFVVSLLIFSVPTHLSVSDYKELKQALNFPNSEHLATEWNSFSRVDVVNSSFTRYAPGLSSEYRMPLPGQLGVLVDGSNMNAIIENTEKADTSFTDYLPSAVGYSLVRNPKTLVINSGAGLDVLVALRNNASVTALESNPTVVDMLKGEYITFSGDIYNRADVHVDEGRGFLKGSGKYDLIVLSLSGNVVSSYGFSENYLLTVEAFRDYRDHLTDDGILVVTRWLGYPPKDSLRLFSIALEVDESARSIAMFRTWTTVTLLLGKTELSAERTDSIRAFAEKNRFDMIYLPAEFEPNKYGRFKEPVYYEGVKRILEDREVFHEDYLFDVSPVYDDRPFYFNFFKVSKMRERYEIIGESWQPFMDPGFLLLFLLAQGIAFSLVFILLPLRIFRSVRMKRSPLVFFFCIGISYLFVEIVLIQRFIMLLGNVAYSFSLVVFSMLLFSGAGSLLSQRLKRISIIRIVGLLFVLILLYSLLVPVIMDSVITLGFAAKAALGFLMIAPLAFFMGMPFPLAIRTVKRKLVPWAWAVNGSASVLSTVIAVFVALSLGYSAVLVLSAFIYLFGALFMTKSA
jgi:hypothetical protein